MNTNKKRKFETVDILNFLDKEEKKKKHPLLEEFDTIVREAHLDFLGTGSDGRHADKLENEWYNLVNDFREELSELLAKVKNET